MNRSLIIALTITGSAASWAQNNPLSTDVKRDYKTLRDYFIKAAEKMPEANYGFKPSPDVRSFGQQVAHVADDQYNLCAPAKGETRKAAYTEIEKSGNLLDSGRHKILYAEVDVCPMHGIVQCGT